MLLDLRIPEFTKTLHAEAGSFVVGVGVNGMHVDYPNPRYTGARPEDDPRRYRKTIVPVEALPITG